MIKLDFSSQMDLQQKVSGWAHDLRSPFNHMVGFSKIVLQGKSGSLTELQKDDLTIVYHSAVRALSLVNNLIEIARLQGREKEAHRAPLDLSALLNDVIDHWRKFNPNQDMPMAVILPDPVPPAMLDKQQMGWILEGFFSYLSAYADGTGHLTVEAARLEDTLLIDLRLAGITRVGNDEIMMEMCGAICQLYLELEGGQIREGVADESQANIQFSIPAVFNE